MVGACGEANVSITWVPWWQVQCQGPPERRREEKDQLPAERGHLKVLDTVRVAFHLVDLGGKTLNTASAMGRMFLTVAAGFAELE